MKLFLVLLLLFVVVCPVMPAGGVQMDGYINKWVVLGPFPNPEKKPDQKGRGAFDVDYLKSIGGESKARINPDTVVTVDGSTKATAKKVEATRTSLDFKKLYTDTDYKLAYAYTEIKAVSDMDGVFFLGSDDGAKVWVNGKLVYEILPPTGRGFTPKQDHFNVKLQKGINRVLVKVENGYGDWQFAVEAYGGQQAKKILADIKHEENVKQFMRQELSLSATWPGYVFWPQWGGAPKIIWRDADTVRKVAGDIPLKVRWFDTNLHEVKNPEKPGRYTAYIEGKTKDGSVIKRAMTFYCAPEELDPWGNWGTEIPYLGKPIDPEVWKERKDLISLSAGDLCRNSMIFTENGSIFMAGLCESKPNGSICTFTESPEVLNDDHQLALKLKLTGLTGKTRPLALPKQRTGEPAEVIREGIPAEADVKPDAKEKIDAICRQWAEDSGEPFTILVARHGVIITHAAFGKISDGEQMPLDYRHDVASITKAVSGMLFSQFVDQGYVKIDEPIGKRVPGYPVTGKHVLTYRHLFTHTSGLEGHGEFGGEHNPYLDNVILNGIDCLHPGTTHIYNGMGYDLAGKAMEYMTGKSIFRMFHENLYRPLGIQNIPMSDLAYSATLTSYELGILGQWLANHGSYGDKQFVSEETFQQMLPVPLGKYYKGLEPEWGIGLVWFREQKPGSKDPKDLILGEHVIGHGSASACVLRVDLDKDLVIAQVRRTAGPKYGDYLPKFLMAVADSLLE